MYRTYETRELVMNIAYLPNYPSLKLALKSEQISNKPMQNIDLSVDEEGKDLSNCTSL